MKYENITVRLPPGTLAEIEDARELRESKLEFIRTAVALEVARRKRLVEFREEAIARRGHR